MKIVSGGQSGVDRAALDVAIARGIPYGGWCPKGGWAEDMPAPPGLLAHYPHLRETPSADPAERTAWNVRDSGRLPDPGRGERRRRVRRHGFGRDAGGAAQQAVAGGRCRRGGCERASARVARRAVGGA
jgi:hypothetical protein